jgi:ribosomal-protein-alanine N-acetyltransferase
MPTPQELKVRPMTEADLDQVLAIETASFSNPWTREHFQGELIARHSFPFVAIADNNILGYVCLMTLFEEAQILDIAVESKQRGRGVAKILLDHAITVALEEGAEVLSLEVRESNIAAIALYERRGFLKSGLRLKYYEGSEDAVLMEKNLKETKCSLYP